MELTPEMIDAAVIQLRTLFQTAENIPEEVAEAGKIFVDKLDAWSERMKASKVSA
jgi:hypothetical protein